MSTKGGFEYTGLRGVDLKNTAAIRLQSDGGFVGTVSMRASADADRAWSFPDKSGSLPIVGTIAVQLPAVTSFGETMVTISGMRREDVAIFQIRDMINTVTTSRNFPILGGARPENGYVNLTFLNPTGTATIYGEMVLSYAIAR